MKLWQKDKASLDSVSAFTIGNDRNLDMYLARYDVLGSLAHISMLETVGLLTHDERTKLTFGLRQIFEKIESGNFTLSQHVEDVHSQVENDLTVSLGEIGKKIHSGRSRNDQVLVDIKLFLRDQLELLVGDCRNLFDLLIRLSKEHQHTLMPGYTHLQLAMPSSFGLWFGAYAESLVDDLITVKAAFDVVNKNPLGSAAGYGSSFPLNRRMTTELLGFSDLNYNVVYAQMGRGKTERILGSAIANVALTLSKLSMDACLFMNQNFGFISFPDELTTGSSIMPHKKNPDVFELIRAKGNQIAAIPNEITLMTANLPSGYHRDLQLIKEVLFPAFQQLRDCIAMMHLMMSNIRIKEDILSDNKYKFLFSVEEVNRLVLSGVPFRDAYKRIGIAIEEGRFNPSSNVQHSHEGSIGNLCLPEIQQMMDEVIASFPFDNIRERLTRLLA